MRKAIQETEKYAEAFDLTTWRQYQFNVRTIKRAMRLIQKMGRSTSKQQDKQLKREEEIKSAYKSLIMISYKFIAKIQQTLKVPVATNLLSFAYITSIKN